MQASKVITAFFTLLFTWTLMAQQPSKPSAVAIYHDLQKLNFLGSVLYVAAHPDDENTRMISYMANHHKARTGYLSLTRGDGGQNLIGPELRELLGVIRTQELIEARKIDGGEQFFTRANDFGFSKLPDETLRIWNKDEVLEDMIYVIRQFQPDVIINRFDHRSPGTTHGHHTSSAMLTLEAFDLTANPKIYPEQRSNVTLWQPKRLLFNTSWWFYGGRSQFEKADKSNLLNLKTGSFYQHLGLSNQEIAALSRSRHQSQGFGSTGSRGDEIEYLELIKGDLPQDKQNLFEGIDTSWNRVKGGASIGKIIDKVILEFDFTRPHKSIPELVQAYVLINKLEDTHWKNIKSKAITEIIAACGGLFLEAVAEVQSTTPGSALKMQLESINRSDVAMTLVSYVLHPEEKTIPTNTPLLYNTVNFIDTVTNLPSDISYTAPYWLEKPGTTGMYTVDDPLKTGIPDIIRNTKVVFNITIDGVTIPFERTVIYKYNDPVKGEVYKPLDIIPEVSIAIEDKVQIFKPGETRTVGIRIKSGAENIQGIATLELGNAWKITPTEIPFNLDLKGAEKTLYFNVTAPQKPEEIKGIATAKIDQKSFSSEQILLEYEHIATQQVLLAAEAKFISLDVKTNQEKIAYIMGAGDEVPNYLTQLGYEISILPAAQISKETLKDFDAVILGIRAYNTIEVLKYKQDILLDFVKGGKTMIVQYNTTGKLVTSNIAPYPLKISRDRVTDENAEVRFLNPNHPVMLQPNKIEKSDFDNWVQERGLYFPDEWDATFTPILSSNDVGESPKDGMLLIAPYGKGHYVYTGISFFRALPAGVSGAYKLLANMIALSQNKNQKNEAGKRR